MARWLPLHQSVSVIRLNCSSVETEEGHIITMKLKWISNENF